MTDLIRTVRESYANNSRLYDYMEREANLPQIVEFLTWDAEQPAFYVYLRRWLDKVPANIRPALLDHIREEEEGDHSGLFRRMFEALREQAGNPVVGLEQEILDRLNYVFSEACAADQNHGFFLGAFLATEFMAQKRCQQLLNGLRRLGVQSDLHYLVIHTDADADHWVEVRDKLIKPALADGTVSVDSVQVGIHHRLESSANFLRYYEKKYLF